MRTTHLSRPNRNFNSRLILTNAAEKSREHLQASMVVAVSKRSALARAY
jgi:hypothetical protein